MLDVDNDIEIKIRVHSSGKIRGYADLIIGGFIKIERFEILQANNGKLYVVNPHWIKNIYNKVEMKREINYFSSASLLEHKDRMKLVNRIIEEFGKELDRLQKDTQRMTGIGNKTYNEKTYQKVEVSEEEWK